MRNKKVLGLLLILVLLLAACGGGNEGAEEDAGADVETIAPEEVTIEVGNELAFNPNEFTIEDGQELVVNMENTGALEHNWVWNDEESEPFLHTNPGETATGTRAFTEPGVYGFYCDIPGHREAGMIGEVTVQE